MPGAGRERRELDSSSATFVESSEKSDRFNKWHEFVIQSANHPNLRTNFKCSVLLSTEKIQTQCMVTSSNSISIILWPENNFSVSSFFQSYKSFETIYQLQKKVRHYKGREKELLNYFQILSSWTRIHNWKKQNYNVLVFAVYACSNMSVICS